MEQKNEIISELEAEYNLLTQDTARTINSLRRQLETAEEGLMVSLTETKECQERLSDLEGVLEQCYETLWSARRWIRRTGGLRHGFPANRRAQQVDPTHRRAQPWISSEQVDPAYPAAAQQIQQEPQQDSPALSISSAAYCPAAPGGPAKPSARNIPRP